MVAGVSKVVIEVEDQERALRFWSDAMGFELVRDSTYGEERWLEVGTPDRRLNLVLKLREGDPPSALDALPTSNVFFYCDDLPRTYGELRFGSGGNRPMPTAETPLGPLRHFERLASARLRVLHGIHEKVRRARSCYESSR